MQIITIDEIRAAYKKLKLKPCKENYIGNTHVNPLIALAILKEGIDLKDIGKIWKYLDEKYTMDFVEGFLDGFDGKDIVYCRKSVEYENGHKNGSGIFSQLKRV